MKLIATALVKAQKSFGPALKSATNPHFRSKYADLASCVDAVIDALNDNGIFLFQTTAEHSDGKPLPHSLLHRADPLHGFRQCAHSPQCGPGRRRRCRGGVDPRDARRRAGRRRAGCGDGRSGENDIGRSESPGHHPNATSVGEGVS